MSKVENILVKPTTEIKVVTNYSALPDVMEAINLFYWCMETQGNKWLPYSVGGTFYNSGLYYSNGTIWVFQETPFGATLSEVNTGTNNNKFVTSFTFENASKWQQYQVALLSGVNIKTINNQSILGLGNITISGTGSSINWLDYIVGASSSSLNTTIAIGTVVNYVYAGVTYFRLIPSSTAIDAFYSTFSNGVLSGLLAQKTI